MEKSEDISSFSGLESNILDKWLDFCDSFSWSFLKKGLINSSTVSYQKK